MKLKNLLSLILLSACMTGFCTTWSINNAGNTYTPATITIKLGDTVNFVITTSHDAREVSQTTWNSNGNTALSGGFQTAFGGGKVLPAQLGVGTHYFVCTPHAAIDMKGTIIVQGATGLTDNRLLTNISFFPNPVSDLITIIASNDLLGFSFIIADQTGRQIMTGLLNTETTLVDISRLASGAYFFLIGQERKKAFKILKN
ncbi:MAG: plastocyanin/azurin family copper-binding protein [bacterium]|nr:plastocyanin/azurin family copper-binding protein [bacterium]